MDADPVSRLMRVLTSLAAALALGWLTGGSCHVSYCDEDCDPCVQRCRCQTSICYRSNAAWAAAHTLVLYERIDLRTSAGDLQRAFRDIRGLSVPLAGGPTPSEPSDTVRFCRDVLRANEVMFGGVAGRCDLLDVLADGTGTLVRFERDEAGLPTDLVTFLLDPRGNLVEITHDRRA